MDINFKARTLSVEPAGKKLNLNDSQDQRLSVLKKKTGALRSNRLEVIAAAADFYDSLNPPQQQVRDFKQRRREAL